MDNEGSSQNFLEERFLLPNLIENLSDFKIDHVGRRKVGRRERQNRQTSILFFFFGATAPILTLACLQETLHFTSVFYILDSR
jgi:hypothetical protein